MTGTPDGAREPIRFHLTAQDEARLRWIAHTARTEMDREALLHALQEIATLRDELRYTERDARETARRLDAMEQAAMDRDLLS